NVAGIDIGTAFTKAVIIAGAYDERPVVIGRGTTKTGVNIEQAAWRAFEAALEEAQLESSDVCYIATTGFGRYGASFRDIQATEITSGARGAHYLFPQTTAVLDIGSQSTRAITLKEGGKVRSFKTNDKCAAGSGSFIVRAAKYLQIDLKEVGELALRSTNPQPISSICAVLAESEIINHVSAGVGVEDILRGIYDSLADRAAMLLKRAGPLGELTFIGGLANQPGMVKALEERIKVKVDTPRHCEYVCALGAALLGLRRLEATRAPRTLLRIPAMETAS
ncbi:MAG TPA: acyl-CoA dehydratase activase, partial [Blastocatellia bacterium]|nr:acyl-CoA dehydratase activase [Blastocatellia bacterium]